MNSVTIDASHYERLVRDAIKYEQLRNLMIKSVSFNKWIDRLSLDDYNILDGLEVIFSTSEYNDLKYRYEDLKYRYEEQKRKEAEEKKAQEEPDNGESTL